jgi:small subunit ribosomal protein S15
VAILHKDEKTKIIHDFGKNAQDTGSTEVQIALLTRNITDLTGHCQANPKDFSSRRGLLKMVCQRKRLLRYLEDTNEGKYKQLISKLGLRN